MDVGDTYLEEFQYERKWRMRRGYNEWKELKFIVYMQGTVKE